MTPLIVYFILAAALFAYICFRWASNTLLNASFKLIYFAMAAASIVFAGMEAGLIITLPK
jgi:hypothetical protein